MADGDFASPLLSLVDKGVGLLLGTVDEQNVPRGTRAWGVRVVGERTIRATFSADDDMIVANASNGWVAITGADVRELRSAQLKGRALRVVEPDDDDLDVAAAHTELFLHAIHETDLHGLELLQRFLPVRMLSVDIEVSDMFDQTPGPSAGAHLATLDSAS